MITKIRTDIKNAMVEKNVTKRDVLKMVLDKANALAKEKKIEVPTDEMVLTAIKNEVKQINQTIEILVSNGKTAVPLYVESVNKRSILETYLPKQMDENELKIAISEYIKENNIDTTNIGNVMKNVMPIFKTKADGKLINKVVRELF